MSYLVDSSVWIDYLRGAPSSEAAWLAEALEEDADILVAGIVAAEVLQGVSQRAQAQRVERLLATCDRAPDLTHQDCLAAARLWRECRQRGATIRSTIDCLIAQLAISHRLTLVTRDRDFQAIAGVAPLRLLALPAH